MSDETDKAINAMLSGEEPTETKTTVVTEEVKTETEAPASETTQEEPAKDSAETDWKAEARKWENRSKENKEKADSFEAAQTKVSELETQVTELTKTHEADLEKSALEITRWKVAAKYGVSESDVALFLNATDEETLVKQAERLSQSSTHAPKPDAAQGNRAEAGPTSTEAQGAAAMSSLFN